MDRLFKMKVDDIEYSIDMHGNGMLVDDVPFVIGTQDGMVTVDGIAFDVSFGEGTVRVGDNEYTLELQGIRLRQPHRLGVDGSQLPESGPGAVCSVMPGVIVRLLVEPGQAVKIGDVLLILEAMKMENEIQAEREGVIKAIHVAPGDRVETGHPLLDITDE